ncbi:hypothetical protein [Helicobacter brantae]|uniref:Uncharacterized protein n=1 Tax=Helicobacter brantae TaxID=375927 RepID=A0A3D8J363_9HELI|nr:hypothetical protein [Helicobacter brantae]RDU71853.1 hypothetical protein CQA58_02075 [Helicobacter brantae]
MVIDIKQISDLEILKERILQGEKIEIREFCVSDCLIKLGNGRFQSYKEKTFNDDMAKVVIEFQKSYTRFLKELKKEFKIEIPAGAEKITFEVSKGSIEFLNPEIFSFLKEVFNNMESGDIAVVLCVLIGAFCGGYAWKKKLNKDMLEIEKKTEIEKQKIAKDEKQDVLKIAESALELLKNTKNNANFERASNGYKEAIINQLEDDEQVSFLQERTLVRQNASEFLISQTQEDNEQEIEEIQEVSLRYYNFKNKRFKIDGISCEANSDILTPDKRIKLMSFADSGKKIQLKLKFLKDSKGKDKEVYILDCIL